MDPQKPSAKKAARVTLRSELITAAFIDALLVLLSSVMLDGGYLLCVCASAVVAHLAVAMVILLRRSSAPSRGDYVFVKWGVWPLLLISVTLSRIFDYVQSCS